MAIKREKFKRLAIAVVLGIISGYNFTPASISFAEEQTQSKAEQAAAIMGASGSMPVVGSTARYSWKSNVSDVNAYPVCTGTKAPTQNEEASFNCVIVGKNTYGAAIPIKGIVSGGKQTLSGMAPFVYLKKIYTSKGMTTKRAMGMMTITININGYQGKTTMSGGDPWGNFGSGIDPWGTDTDNTGTGGADFYPDDSGFGNSNSQIDYFGKEEDNPKGNSSCPDGYYFCTASNESTELFGNGAGNEKYSNSYYDKDGSWYNPDGSANNSGISSGGYYDKDGIWHNPDGSDNDNSISGSGYYDKNNIWHNSDESGGAKGELSYDNNSDSNYGDAINKILNDDSSYNSGDSDWTSSTAGNNGSNNLDDYFNGIENGSDSLDGVTEDLLGVDDDLLNSAEEAGKNTDSFNEEDDDFAADDNYYNNDDSNDSAISDNASILGEGNSVQDLMNAIDGITSGDEDNIVTDNNSSSSLANSLSKFLKELGGSEAGVTGRDATEQDLFEIAKKLLLANGLSLDDIINGKSYDKGSAYTEPRQAWDMNRITTLLKSGKIKPQTGEAAAQSKLSLTNASNRNKAINATKNN